MNGVKMCLGVMGSLDISAIEQIKLFKETGFEAFFYEWTPGCNLDEIIKAAEENGIEFYNVHAPFSGPGNVSFLWEQHERTETSFNTLRECIRDCAEHGIKLVVMHAYIGFEKHEPTQMGVDLFGKLVDYAASLGVKIAFENTEGEEYLACLMENFKDKDNVGFCWDTGHELCYNRSKDMTHLYGDRLFCTHINDNLGIKDYNGSITYIDDLHLLPFDGINDWESVAQRLAKCNVDTLTFELTVKSKQGRHENDLYAKITPEEYLSLAYTRACRVATLYKKYKNI